VLVITAVLFAVLEGKNFGVALWWAVVTASTVGYGDTYPLTVGGRIVAGILISSMVLLVIPLVTAHFASKLIVDQDAFRHEEQEEIKEQLRRIRELTEQLVARGVLSEPDSATPPRAPADR
jgi:voltage-gated potassium channel